MSWLPVSSGSASLLRPSSLDCLSCDPYKELLWTGSADGALTCLYPHSFERRVRVQAHERGAGVLALAPFARGVLSASRAGVRLHSRGGVLLSSFDTDSFITDITAASPSVLQGDSGFPPSEILLAGWSVDGDSAELDSSASDAHPTVALMDLVTNACLMSRATESASACVASGRVIACGGMDPGSALSLFDARDFSPVRSLPGHSGGSRRLIIKGDRLVSIGYTVPPSAGSLDGSMLASAGRADQLVKIYDLRTFRALPPLLFSLGGGPADAAFLPNFTSLLLVAGVTGVWQTVDAEAGLPDAHAYEVEMSAEPLTGMRASISSMTMSSTGDLLFFGDSAGGVHQWTDKSEQIVAGGGGLEDIRINAFSAPVDYVPAGTHSIAPVHMDEHSALTTLALPSSIDATTLISALPARDMIATFPPPSMPPLDDKLLHMNYQVKFANGIQIVNLAAAHHHASSFGAGGLGGKGFATTAASRLLAIKEGRADASEDDSRSGGGGGGGGAFLPNHMPTLMKFAGKGRKVDRLHQKKSLLRAAGLTSSAAANGALEEYSQVRGVGSYITLQRDALISKEYARVTIKIPRFGLYAFDFSSYNKTHFTGLDNLLPNSYVNPVLQLLYFLPRIRTTMLAHVCEREYCLTCELGFLFHMMDHGGQRGRPHTAEPRNFLRSLKQLPEAGGLGLLDLDEPLTAKGASAKEKAGNGADDDLFLAAKIQDFMRFLLEQLAKEERDSPAFQGRLHGLQNQRAQVQYSFQMNQQRRLRNFNLAAQQLQQSFAALQAQILPPNGSASPAMEASVTQSLRHQLNQFLNQSQMLFDETERHEAEQLQQQLAASAASDQTEGNPASPRSNGNNGGTMPQTTIERVFGSVMQQRTFCHGTAQSFGSSSQQQHQAHESIQDKPTLYFKLNAYPLHETDLTFDGLLTNSLRDNSGSGSVAAPSGIAGGSTPSWLGGGGSADGGGGSAGLSTQRLFCNSCSTFTIQSSEKSLKPASAGTTPGALASAAANGSFSASNPGPLSHFPNALTIMANVSTDMEWEWWKRRDERFARTLANRKKMGGGGTAAGTGAQQNANSLGSSSSTSTAKPTNLYGRFMAAAGDDSAASTDQAQQQQQQPAAPAVVFRAGVVNAGAASSSASASSTASTLPAPPAIAPIPQLSDDQLDALDVHFLPHFLLLLIDTHSNPHSPQTRSFRLLPSYARQLSAAINELREMQASHIASQQALSQSLVSTQLLVCQLQSQLLALSQQNFFVQSKLNFAVNQHANLMHGMHAITQQANQALAQQQQQQQGGGAAGTGLPPALQQRLHSMQSNLTHLQNQTHQLNAQKMQIQQSVHALQTTGLSGGVSIATAGAPAASGTSAGLAALQRKAQEIQSQIQAAAHQYLLRISEGESELRKMIITQLGSATQSSSRASAGGGGGSSSYAANHTATFSPSFVSHLTLSDVAVYELTAVVSAIADPPEKYSPLHSINGEHLVAHIKVDRAVYDQVGADAAARDALRLVRQVSPNAAVSTTPVPDRSRYGAQQAQASVAPSPHSPTTLPAAVSADAHDGCWFVFNDFVIRPSNGFEATRFNYLWKQPCAVVFKLLTAARPASPAVPASSLSPPPALRSPGGHPMSPHSLHMHQQHQFMLASPFMNEALIYQTPPSLSTAGGGVGGVVAASGGGSRFRHGGGGAGSNVSPAPLSFQPLVPRGPHAEVMDPSSLVAIDCEFVSVQHELTEVDEITGENVVVRPARLSLARVSVVRGSGPMMGVPFIDDYIACNEPVVDYLTKYSGIVAGDLDRATSPHHLVSLKSAYVRLRALVERGVRFIGHGLKKDLQMINMCIPAEQICDTVELFSLANQRKLSLRFLAQHLLQSNIQQDTHDSIEDARTALQLYYKYRELKSKGQLQQVLHQLYEQGHRSGFKV